MTYDDIRKDLALWTDFLLPLKKDISSGQIRNYPNVLNALIRLGKIIRSLKKILDKQDNKAIRGSYDDIKNSIKEISDIVSDSIGKPASSSWIKVTGRLESFIAELNDLSELLAETSQSQPKSEEKDGQKSKYTPEKIKNMQASFDKHIEENKGVKYAWECVAEEHGLKTGKAAEMAVRRHQEKNK